MLVVGYLAPKTVYLNRKNQWLISTFFLLLLNTVIITASISVLNVNVLQFIDVLKLLTLLLGLHIIKDLRQINVVTQIGKLFVAINGTFIILQLIAPHLPIWVIVGENAAQTKSLTQYPFGLLGHRTASALMLCSFAILFLNMKQYRWFIITTTLILLMGNKISLIILLIGFPLTVLLLDIGHKAKIQILLLFTGFVAPIIIYVLSIYAQTLIWYYSQGEILEVHTISHRMSFLTQFKNQQPISYFVPTVDKNDWLAAFDSQLLLLSFRYGLLIFPLVFMYTYSIFKLSTVAKLYSFILFSLFSLTAITHYHGGNGLAHIIIYGSILRHLEGKKNL